RRVARRRGDREQHARPRGGRAEERQSRDGPVGPGTVRLPQGVERPRRAGPGEPERRPGHRQPRHQAGAVPRPDGRDHAGHPDRGRLHHQSRGGEAPQGCRLQGQAVGRDFRQRQEVPRQVRPGTQPVKKETIVLGSVAAVCVSLLVAALIVRSGGHADGSSQAGVAPAAEEGAVPAAATGETAGGATPPPGEAATPPPEPEESAAPSFTSEQNRREVTLFFQETASESLGPERRKIFLTSSVADQAKQIVVELITGPLEKQLLPTL